MTIYSLGDFTMAMVKKISLSCDAKFFCVLAVQDVLEDTGIIVSRDKFAGHGTFKWPYMVERAKKN